MKILGAIIFVGGILVWCGNVFRFLPTFPMAGYLSMALGGWMYRSGEREQ